MDRRKRGANANNLLNFTSHQRSPQDNFRPQNNWNNWYSPAVRRTEKGRYVQTFRCHILDTTAYAEVSSVVHEVDALLPWEAVRRVDLMTEKILVCPVCLDDSITVPKITKCGHVFCLVCIVRHLIRDPRSGLAAGDSGARRCPVCNDDISLSDLRTVRFQRVGENRALVLCRKAPQSRGLTLAACAPPLPRDRLMPDVPREGDEGWHFSRLIACSHEDIARQEHDECAALHDFRVRCVQNFYGDTEMLPFVDHALNHMYDLVDADTPLPPKPLDPYFRVRLPRWPKGGSKGSNAKPSACRQSHEASSASQRPSIDEEYRIAESGPVAACGNSTNTIEAHEDGSCGSAAGSPKSVDSWCVPISQGTRLEPAADTASVEVEETLDADSGFSFYQMSDGQQTYLHPFWHKPLLACFKRYHLMPAVLRAPLADVEATAVTTETRKTSGFLRELTLGAAVKFVDADLRRILDGATKKQFGHEFKERRRLQERERRRQRKAEDWVASKASNAEALYLEEQKKLQFAYNNERVPTSDDFVPLSGHARPDVPAVSSDADVETEPSGPTLAERLRALDDDLAKKAKEEEDARNYFPPLAPTPKPGGPNLQPIAWGRGIKAKTKAKLEKSQPKDTIDNEDTPAPVEGDVPNNRPQGVAFADIIARQKASTKKKKPQPVRLFG